MKNATELIDILVKGMDKISKINDRSDMHHEIEKILAELLEAEYFTFLLMDHKENKFYSLNKKNHEQLSMAAQRGLIGNAFMTKTPSIYNHVKSEKMFDAQADNPKDLKIKAQIIYPLMENDSIVGMLRVSRSIKQSNSFTNYDVSLLKSIEPYLLKMVHILLNDVRKDAVIDRSTIDNQVNDLAKKSKNDNADINDTVMFLANTVHDIRTPANSLYGFLELMEEQTDDPKMLDFISGAKESAEFINTLTDSILDRIKHENEVRNAAPITITTIKYLASIANIFTANMTNKKIHYLVHVDPFIPSQIIVDAVKLKRVLINLIGNAYKFTPANKKIEFSVTYNRETNRIKFAVIDEGLGIPKERQQEIFKAFEQAQEDTSIHFGGTGLGLAISSKYVQEMGGKLELDSEVDMGSTFYFEIPVNTENATLAYLPFGNVEKKIIIYTNDNFCIDANNIKRFLVEAGMPEEKIVIGDKIPKDTTHFFCFEHKFNDKVIEVCKEHNIKLVVFEESLFSISKQAKYKELKTIAKNTYYENVLYSTVSSRKKPKVLIVDDNRVNVKLLESMLEGVYCDVYHDYDAENALEKLKSGLEKNHPCDIIFLDKHMPGRSGTDMLKEYRELESKYPLLKSTYAVSITGEASSNEEEKKLYDEFIRKPFKSSDIRDIFKTFEN